MDDHEVTVGQEIANTSHTRPHVVLLGAGASFAALPNGDKKGRSVPLLKDVAESLKLVDDFPEDLKDLAIKNFEQAYSDLFVRNQARSLKLINDKVFKYFAELELPDEPNLYDTLNLSLRDKDAIFTFNWDPFLMQSRIRLARLGVTKSFPKLFFLHGNVTAGYCLNDKTSGIVGNCCSQCGESFKPSQLLYPTGQKDYQDPFIVNEWLAVQLYLKECFMFTIFGYSAPTTDKEAIDLLKKGWGDVKEREMEQTEVINQPGADRELLRETWEPFIHSHHYKIFESYYDSWLANHPRRSIEAYLNQNSESKFVRNNKVPKQFVNLKEMAEWFKPLLDAERSNQVKKEDVSN
jgi:hypothetical protein